MRKTFISLAVLCGLAVVPAVADDYIVSTPNTSIIISASKGGRSYIQYYGPRIDRPQVSQIYDAGDFFWEETYPTFGIRPDGEKALSITQPDGNMSVDLYVQSVSQTSDAKGDLTEIVLRDSVYPITVRQYYLAYAGTDIIGTWTEISNGGKKPVTMYKYASAVLPVRRGDNWLTHLSGTWAAENMMEEEPVSNSLKVLTNKDGVRNTQSCNPSVMISLDGKPDENVGGEVGASLAWSGNYKLTLDAQNGYLRLIAGICEDNSQYVLDKGESFVTPQLLMAYSSEGKGGVSRAFHSWARAFGVHQGSAERDILLNSWEGVYFNVNQDVMSQMMKDISDLGGELFVMDDGWFGNKYPRNNGSQGLGDWDVCTEKLPGGIEGLVQAARDNHIKFGIWIEPEMANTKSELFEKHPDWVLSQDNRPLSKGRGGTQVTLDLTNPKVQDFVFGVVDRLMTKYPDIAYIKWDANCCIMNYGSHYLSPSRQSQIYVDYHRGLNKVLERIRAKYPRLVMQACASGGGRVNYGLLPYFDEFWTSDDTDALQRIFIQWGTSNFFPALCMASHVSADRNHQTGRSLPLKFRFDVAMTGRLGMEIQPKNMSDADKEFARRAIAAYKSVRQVVQFGDLYRLISPYDNKGVASLMYATPDRDRAVVFAYKLNHFINMKMPVLKLTGINETKSYKIHDLTPARADKPSSLDGKVISGKVLKYVGLTLDNQLRSEYSSLALELTAEN